MRLISINALQEGMVVGRTIWNEAGHPLLQKSVLVTQPIISRLRQLNIQYIYIDDSISSGIQIEETVNPEVRNRAVHSITQSFAAIKNVKQSQASYVLDQQSKVISNIVEELLDSILNNEEVLTLLTDTYLYDEYLYTHSFQVTMYSLAIAKQMGYKYEDLRIIGIGAMLHDIGKLLIPTEILNKPGSLNDAEYEEMKQHTRYGFDLLRNLHSVSLLVAHCAFQHHERLDGSGYPRGLVNKDIHPYAKIIGVADVFDAVTSERIYRGKMFPSQGIAIIEKDSGTLYDPLVVAALKKSVVHYPNGTVLVLSDNRRAVVSKQNDIEPARPWIRVFEEDDIIINTTYEINLLEYPNITIEKIVTDYVTIE